MGRGGGGRPYFLLLLQTVCQFVHVVLRSQFSFSSVQDGMHALGKSQHPSLKSFPLPIETVPIFV